MLTRKHCQKQLEPLDYHVTISLMMIMMMVMMMMMMAELIAEPQTSSETIGTCKL